MNLVKWFRRNNKKVMAVVVIVIMIGFIGGTALTQLLQRNSNTREVVGHLGEKTKIRADDLRAARQELGILQRLQADTLLKSRDIHGFFLGELLFSDRAASAALVNRVKLMVRQNRFNISDQQIDAIYGRLAPPSVYWHCLQYETEAAGIRLDNDEVARLLAYAIPQLFGGATDSQVIGHIMKETRLPEERIIATMGKLLAVLEYARLICSSENVTTRQIMHLARVEQETINAGYVKFDASAFTENLDDPDNGKLAEHFEKHKDFFGGEVSDNNPRGFGYKLSDRVQLEYMVVKLDDVRTIVTPPTQDEMGDYYNRNKDQSFTEQVQSDPNDPNSMTERVKGYAEVVDSIEKDLMKSRIMARAEAILQQARTATETELQNMDDADIAALSTEQFRSKLGDDGDYGTVAANLSTEHKIKVYTGRTGTLGPLEFQTDEQLSRLVTIGYGRTPAMLSQVVFAVKELEAGELGVFDAPEPRMYENIGPVRDWMTEYGDVSGTVMGLVRVVEAKKASAPESLEQTFSISSFVLDPNEEEADESTYSVKEKVADDVKKLAAMETAKAAAEDFIAQAVAEGWQVALDSVNKLHKEQYGLDANDPDPFSIENSGNMRRISRAALDTMALQRQSDPAGQFGLRDDQRNKRFADRLYSLVPPDKTTSDDVPLVIEVQEDMSHYAIRNISVKRLWKEDYEDARIMRSYNEDYICSQSLAAVHFNPESILKRLNVRWVRDDEEPADANAPGETEAAP